MKARSTSPWVDWRVQWIFLAGILISWLAVTESYSQDRLSAARYKSGQTIRRAFRDLITEPKRGIVEIYHKDELIAHGAVMSAEGEILTKASEVKGEVVCKLHDDRRLPAKVIARDRDTDLALLKIDAKDLPVLAWEEDVQPNVGQWFITAGLKELPLSVGIVSVADRRIPPERGVLGVKIANEDTGAVITKVYSNSSAARAGLKVGDIVTRVANDVINTNDSLASRIGRMRPGDSLKLLILREKKELEVTATLGYPQQEMSFFRNRGNFQNRLGGALSTRRGGFDSIIQHDSVLAPNQCGGPVIGLSGKALGLNIARGGRTESYALPAKTVLKTYQDLKADSLASESAQE